MLAKKVRDVMVPLTDYAVVSKDKPLKEAVAVLKRVYCEVESGACTEAGHRAVLILGANDELLGVMDFRSLLSVLIPEIAGSLTERLRSLGVSIAFAEAGAQDLDEARSSFRARVLKNAETLVEDVMLKPKGVIQAEDDLLTALKLMHRNRIVVLPVYEDGKLVGVLRDSDLFLCVAADLTE
ncbi:MAG: CBS domain-containing protein [Pseudomonadota bacterium]